MGYYAKVSSDRAPIPLSTALAPSDWMGRGLFLPQESGTEAIPLIVKSAGGGTPCGCHRARNVVGRVGRRRGHLLSFGKSIRLSRSRRGGRLHPSGVPASYPPVKGRSPDDPWISRHKRQRPRQGVAEVDGEVRHPGGVEVKTSTFPQVIAAVAARPVAMKRGSLAGSGIPLWCRLPFTPPAGRSGGAPEPGRGGLERASGRTEEGWGWASDLSDLSDSSDRARSHPKTPGLLRYAIIYTTPTGCRGDKGGLCFPGVVGATPLRPLGYLC